MTQKIELMSPEWLAALRGHIERFLETPKGKTTTWSVCEVFTGVPKHLDKNGTGVLSWHCRIIDGKLTFEDGEVSDVDMKSTVDYDFILPLARLKLGPETAAEMAALSQKGVETGKMIREGDSSTAPVEFHAIHNDLADITV